MTVALKKWFKGDWNKLKNCIDTPEDYPEKPANSHLFLSDIRKFIFLLENPLVGLINEEQYEWADNWDGQTEYPAGRRARDDDGYIYKAKITNTGYQPKNHPTQWEPAVPYGQCRPLGAGSSIYKYVGDWTIATYDNSHGVGGWVFWQNRIDLTEAAAHNCENPPNPIHPVYEIWDGGNYDEGAYVSWPLLSGLFYKAKRNNSGKQPDENPDDWEVSPIWITSNDTWELSPSLNKYHHWDKNFPGIIRKTDVLVSGGSEVGRNQREYAPCLYYPPDTDPKTQWPPIIYADTQQKDYQYKEKLKIAKNHISNPAVFGGVFKSWRFFPNIAGNAIICMDSENLKVYGSAFYGNQYANTMILPFDNSPDSDKWSSNPKVLSGDFQSRIECVLDAVGLRMPADTQFKKNWRKSHYPDWYAKTWYQNTIVYQPDDEELYIVIVNSTTHEPPHANWRKIDADECPAWITHPSIKAMEWGRNESGFEKLKYDTGKFDYFFQTSYPFVPSLICKKIIGWREQIPVTTPSYNSGWEAGFDCSNLLGTLKGSWRVTWMNSMGRASPFMRSLEMGEPDWSDGWNPNDEFTPHVLGNDLWRWFGSISHTYPALNQFDDKFENITKIADRIFQVSGDKTGTLKVGYMVHLCEAETQLISGDGDITPAYVFVISYDAASNKTTVKITEDIGDFTKIGWNQEISERHDPKPKYKSNGEVVLQYDLTAEMLYEMFEILNATHYIESAFDVQIKYGAFPDFGFHTYDAQTIGKYLNSAIAECQKTYDDDVEDNPCWQGTPPEEAPFNLGSYTYCLYNPPGSTEWYLYVENAQLYFTAIAIKATWSQVLKGQPKHIWLRVSVWDSKQLAEPSNLQSIQTAGPLHTPNIVAYNETARLHYLSMRLEVDGDWHFLIPKLKPLAPYREYQGNPPGSKISLLGEAFINIDEILVDETSIFIEQGWKELPDDVWDFSFLNHLDASLTSEPDALPPRPNPPRFSTEPYVYFKFVRPYTVGQYEQWEEGAYNEDDYRLYGTELYQAKQNIEEEDIPPPNNPTEWLWIPPKFEMRVKSEICLCEDYEGSDPVLYRAVGMDSAPTSDWSTSREPDVYIKDIELPAAINLLNVATQNPSGTQTKIYHSGSQLSPADSLIEIRGTNYNNGIWRIVTGGSDGGGTYFVIDKGWYQVETIPADYAVVYNWSDIYTAADWNNDIVKNYQFKAQSKDGASPQNNESQLSAASSLINIPPEIYPAEMIEDACGLGGL